MILLPERVLTTRAWSLRFLQGPCLDAPTDRPAHAACPSPRAGASADRRGYRSATVAASVAHRGAPVPSTLARNRWKRSCAYGMKRIFWIGCTASGSAAIAYM